MNWRYRVDNEDFILTQQEHEYVKSLIKKGEKGMVYLRDESIQINLVYVKYAKKTEQQTEQQSLALFKRKSEEKEINLLAGETIKAIGHKEFYEKMGWKWEGGGWQKLEEENTKKLKV